MNAELDLNDYFYFVQVVEKRGFTAAARTLNVPKSRLSRHVQQLETRLGVRLLQRSSRRFVVTEVGEAFYRHARAALDQVEAAEAEVLRQTSTLAGQVRLSCSVGMARFALLEIVTRFLVDNPKVDIIQNVTNQPVDLLASGIDIALRGHSGALPDSTFIQRRVARTPWYLFASPAYLDRTGDPSHPDELEGHVGLKAGSAPESDQWSLRGPNDVRATVPFTPRLCTDDMSTLKEAAAAGLGIVALPGYVCRHDVESTRLVRVLPEWTAADAQLSMIMPSARGRLPAVEALAEHLRLELPRVTDV